MDQRPTGKYAPLGAWAYFGLTVLFSIPVVGLVFLVIFSINGSNINRRNFARSYWCVLVLLAIIIAILFLTGPAVDFLTKIGYIKTYP
ncbi:MAG: hypothetical protein IK088_03575 [Lachnospiraceae bacterium]|nr:hypothetical protein [Lachnospiraceae bacterium]